MIKLLKKHKYKLLTLMLSIVSIFTLFLGINKTYAYQSNEVSYTLDYSYDETTIGNYTGVLLNHNMYYDYVFTIKNNGTANENQMLIVNLIVFDENNNVVDRTMDSGYFRFYYNQSGTLYSTINYGRNWYDNIYTRFYYIYNTNMVNATQFRFRVDYRNSTYKYLLLNADLIYPNEIGMSQYYGQYYQQIEQNYNALLSEYNNLQDDYDTLEGNYNTLQDNYDTLEDNYNNLNSQVESLQSQITTLQNQKNTLEQQLEQINEEYYYIINQVAPFNPSNIQSTSVIFNNTTIDIPYNSFVIFDYFQIELDLSYFDILNTNDYRHLIQSMNNKLTITLNLEKPIIIDNLEYWCSMRDFYDDCLNLTLLNNENIINEYFYMNNEHQDSQGDMAPYYISSGGKNINRLVFEFVLNDTFYNNYQGKIDYMVQSGTYTQGYNDGLNASNQYIYKLKNEIIEDEQYILSLERTINVLQEQVNSFSSDYNLNNLMWTIASTPFESFKQIWNVDFFGVNISTMITGFITGLVVLWIIKKFFL